MVVEETARAQDLVHLLLEDQCQDLEDRVGLEEILEMNHLQYPHHLPNLKRLEAVQVDRKDLQKAQWFKVYSEI